VDVRKAIKTSEGTVVFEGELSQEEHDYVLGIGLMTLLEQGALPFKHLDDEDLASASVQPSEYEQ
jgi:hypothetical protein